MRGGPTRADGALAGPARSADRPALRIYEDPDEEELVIEIGPVALPENAMHGVVEQPPAQRAPVPIAGWLRGFRVTLVDGDGRPLPRDLLHHVNVIAPGQRELFSNIMLRLAAAGSETAPIRLPRLLGIPVERGDELLVTAMFHNSTDTSYSRVYLRARMPYTPEDAWIAPLSVRPFYLDVMPPASGHAYDLPPGRSERSWEGSPAIPGRILGVGGHLHRYAEKLLFEDVTAGEVIWEAEPIEDERGDVLGMPTKTFWWTLGERIRPDHVYRLTAIYDNPTGRMIEHGAMGALGGIVLPSGDAEWPAADRDHPEYRLDVRLVTEGAYGPDAPGHHDHAVDPAQPDADGAGSGDPAGADPDGTRGGDGR
ncbi:MAG: hypothetical protein ACOC9N_03540 [Gemmatimonadota bacterium]